MASAGFAGRQNHNFHSNLANSRQAQLANAYSSLASELSSDQLKVVGGYTLGKVIGEGSYGSVHIASHRLTGMRCAIKKVAKTATPQLTREIHHHRRLHHPHIVHLHEIIATESNIWLVSELCPGGELFDYLVERGRLLEGEARRIFGELCMAVGWLHKQGIVHRDLKLENVLLDGELHVKLGDLGFAREYQKGRFMETFCGTTGYASPEMLACKKYLGVETDVWSLGIILYTLLCGGLPFDDDDERVMKDLILKGDYEEPEWLTKDARSLIRGMLAKDPAHRLTMDGILTHPWFQKTIYDSMQTAASTISLPLTVPPSPIVPPAAASTDSLLRTRVGSTTSLTSFPFSPRTASSARTHQLAQEALATSPSSDPSETSFEFNDRPRPISGDTSPTTVENDDEPEIKRVNSGEFSHVERTLELLHGNRSSSTIRKPETSLRERIARRISLEGASGDESEGTPRADKRLSGQSLPMIDELSLTLPVADHSRTPIRTKRRSLTSQLPLERRLSHHSTSSQWQAFAPDDYLALLNAELPPLFSTPSEKVLVDRLSSLGFDIGQMMHSVKNDACDCSSAMWWIMRLKQVERGETDDVVEARQRRKDRTRRHREARRSEIRPDPEPQLAPDTVGMPSSTVDKSRLIAPEFEFAPPPTAQERPRSGVSTHSTITDRPLSPVIVPLAPAHEQSPSKEKPKMRTQSMNMLQRATSVLVGGIKKADPIEHLAAAKEHHKESKENKENKEHRDDHATADTAEEHKRGGSPTKFAHLAKPMLPKMTKSESDSTLLSLSTNTAPMDMITPETSPTRSRSFNATSPGLDQEMTEQEPKAQKKDSIWNTFRYLFNEDRRRRKREAGPPPVAARPGKPPSVIPTRGNRVGPSQLSRVSQPSSSRRTSYEGSRPMYSHRSSTANSRRSSIASNHVPDFAINMNDGLYHTNLNRRASGRSARSALSAGSMTPTSDREPISRPGSTHSRRGSRRSSMLRSPTINSDASSRFRPHGPASPLHDYHRRSASGSASTRVRHIKVLHEAKAIRPSSVASSQRSGASSRASSLDLARDMDSDTDARDDVPGRLRRNDSGPSLTAIRERTRSPLSRTDAKPPLRDVFSKKDDEEWESETDDPSFAVGLGQSAAPRKAANVFQTTWGSASAPAPPAAVPQFSVSAPASTTPANSNGGPNGVSASPQTSVQRGFLGSARFGQRQEKGGKDKEPSRSGSRRAGLPTARTNAAPVIEEEEEEEE